MQFRPELSHEHGFLVISLDFELFWGMRDKRSIASYGANIRGAREAIPKMIELFDRYGVNVTFATVGLLFFNNKEEMLASQPTLYPSYFDANLSPFNGHFDMVGASEREDPYHYASDLIQAIIARPAHEVACHTFSHYYCLEPGQTEEQFAADLRAAKQMARKFDLQLSSFVFPRNQYNADYLKVCHKHGITSFRGNEASWLYDARIGQEESSFRRALRLLDTWFNLSGHNCHVLAPSPAGQPLNIPASRFLRPWSRHWQVMERFRLKRITKAMDHAARTGKVFHLWWHPHNFGRDLPQNMAFLEKILAHFQHLRNVYGMRSMTMRRITEAVNRKDGEA